MFNPNKLPCPDDIIKIAEREGKIRLSKEYIDECTAVKDEVNGWLRITGEMQKRIVTEYLQEIYGEATPAGIDIGVNMLRNAQVLFPDNDIVQNLVYVKNNKANIGRFKAGDKLEDIKLHTIDGKSEISLFDLLSDDKINIVIAASHT